MKTVTVMWILYFTGMIVWIFPSIKNYNTRYFFFFLIFAIEDPLIWGLSNIPPYVSQAYMHFAMGILSVLSLLTWATAKKTLFIIIPVLLGTIVFFKDYIILHGYDLNALLSILLLIIFFQHFIIDIRDNENINLFYVVIILYIFLLVLKFIFRDEFRETGYIYFWISTAFQLLPGIYFGFYNVETAKRLSIYPAQAPAG